MVSGISKETFSKVDSNFKLAILPKVLATLSKIPITLNKLRSLYFGDKKISEETLANYINLIGDIFFVRGIMEAVDIQMNNDNSGKTYLYQFSYDSETSFMKKILNVDFPGIIANKFETLMNLIYDSLMFNCIHAIILYILCI